MLTIKAGAHFSENVWYLVFHFNFAIAFTVLVMTSQEAFRRPEGHVWLTIISWNRICNQVSLEVFTALTLWDLRSAIWGSRLVPSVHLLGLKLFQGKSLRSLGTSSLIVVNKEEYIFWETGNWKFMGNLLFNQTYIHNTQTSHERTRKGTHVPTRVVSYIFSLDERCTRFIYESANTYFMHYLYLWMDGWMDG